MRVAWLCFVFFVVEAHANSFHFVILGDRTGRAVPGVYEQAWREAVAAKPDFIVTVGDAIEGMNDETAPAEWRYVKQSWSTTIPVYHTPGNHDIWDAFSEKLFVEETARKPFYSFDFRNAHFVILDNSRTEDLAPSQLEFLENDLTGHASKGPVLVFFHRPFWLIPMKLGANGFVLEKLAARYGVCCYVSGHGHQLQSVERNGVFYLEVGSSGASLARAGAVGVGYADGWFYQYVYVTVEDRQITFEVRELSAPYGEGRKQIFRESFTNPRSPGRP